MTYSIAPMGRYHLGYLGQSTEPLNGEEVLNTTVEPGSSWTFTPWLDAALTVSGIPSEQAGRVPAAIRQILESVGSQVDRVAWGGGDGLESIRGKVYVRWRPDKPYNAVDYANIASRLFMAAASGFPAGARISMNRYRVDNPVSSDLYVYTSPDRAIPPSAPEAARQVMADSLPAPVREGSHSESVLASNVGVMGVQIAAIAGGGALVLGLAGWWYFKGRKVKRNRRRRSR